MDYPLPRIRIDMQNDGKLRIRRQSNLPKTLAEKCESQTEVRIKMSDLISRSLDHEEKINKRLCLEKIHDLWHQITCQRSEINSDFRELAAEELKDIATQAKRAFHQAFTMADDLSIDEMLTHENEFIRQIGKKVAKEMKCLAMQESAPEQ